MSNEDLPESPGTASGLPPSAPEGETATADAPSGPVESDAAGQGSDPDLIADDDLDAQDPA